MSDKLKKLRLDKSEAELQLKQFQSMLKAKVEELFKIELTKEEAKQRTDLVDKIYKLQANFQTYRDERKKLNHIVENSINMDDIDEAVNKLLEIDKKDAKDVNELKRLSKQLKPLTDKTEQSSKIKKSQSQIVEAITLQKKQIAEINKKIQQLTKNLGDGKGNQDKLEQITLNAKKKGPNKTISAAEGMKKQASLNKEEIIKLRKKQHKENQDKNPKKEKIKKALKKGSTIKDLEELRMLYNQVLDVVPIRIIIEEALRCLIKKIGFDQWRRELCRAGLKNLPEALLDEVILPLFNSIAIIGKAMSTDNLAKIRVNVRNQPLMPSELPGVSSLIKRFEGLGIQNKYTEAELERYINSYVKYSSLKTAARALMGPDLQGEHSQKGVYLNKIDEAFNEVMEELNVIFDIGALCDALFDNIPEFAFALAQFGISKNWEELWAKAKAATGWPPVLPLPDFIFPPLDLNKGWKKGLVDSLQQLLFQFVGTLAGFLADALSQACEDDLPGEADMRSLLPPIEVVFPDEPCIDSLKNILDELSLLLTPGEICSLFEGEIARITYPINESGFILNLHNYSQDEFYDFRTDELLSFIQKYVSQRYPGCAYLFDSPEEIADLFRRLGEVSTGCPEIANKERKFCETEMQREINKLRLEVFCERGYGQEDIDCLLEKANQMRIKRTRQLMNALFDDKFFERFTPPMNCYKDPDTKEVLEGLVPIPPTMEFMIDETLDGLYEAVKINYERNINSFVPFMIDQDPNSQMEKIDKEISGTKTEAEFEGGKVKLVKQPGSQTLNPIYAQNFVPGKAFKDSKGTPLDAETLLKGPTDSAAPSQIYIYKGTRKVFPELRAELKSYNLPITFNLAQSLSENQEGVESYFRNQLLGVNSVWKNTTEKVINSNILTLSYKLTEPKFSITYFLPKTTSTDYKGKFEYYFRAEQKPMGSLLGVLDAFPQFAGNPILKDLKSNTIKVSDFKEEVSVSPDVKKMLDARAFSLKSDYNFLTSIPQKLFASFLENILEDKLGLKINKNIRQTMAGMFYEDAARQIVSELSGIISKSTMFDKKELNGGGEFLVIENIDLDPSPTEEQKQKKCGVSLIDVVGLKEGVKNDYRGSRCDVDPSEIFGKEEVDQSDGRIKNGPSLLEKYTADSALKALIRINIIDFFLRGIFPISQFGSKIGSKNLAMADSLLPSFFYDLFAGQIQRDLTNQGARRILEVTSGIKEHALVLYNREYAGRTIKGFLYPEKNAEEALEFYFADELAFISGRFKDVVGFTSEPRSLSLPIIDSFSPLMSGANKSRLPIYYDTGQTLRPSATLFFEKYMVFVEKSNLTKKEKEVLDLIKKQMNKSTDDALGAISVSDADRAKYYWELASKQPGSSTFERQIQENMKKIESVQKKKAAFEAKNKNKILAQVDFYAEKQRKVKELVEKVTQAGLGYVVLEADIKAGKTIPKETKIISLDGKTIFKTFTGPAKQRLKDLADYYNELVRESKKWKDPKYDYDSYKKEKLKEFDKEAQKFAEEVLKLNEKIKNLQKQKSQQSSSSKLSTFISLFKQVRLGMRLVYIPRPVKSLNKKIPESELTQAIQAKILADTFAAKKTKNAAAVVKKENAYFNTEVIDVRTSALNLPPSSAKAFTTTIPLASTELVLTRWPGKPSAAFAASEDSLIKSLKQAPEYEFATDYCLGDARLRSVLTSHCIMESTTSKKEIAANFKATRNIILSVWETAKNAGDFKYKDPLVSKGVSENLKNGQDIEDLLLALLLKAPWVILKNLAENYDFNISLSKRILDAGRAIAEVGINVTETGFSIAEQVGVAAEMAKQVAVASGTWNLMDKDERDGIQAAIDSLNDIPPHPKRKEVYDEIRFYLENIPTATISIPIWIGLWIWPTTFGIVYLVGDAIEKGKALYEHNKQGSTDDPASGTFSVNSAKARERLLKEMRGYGVDLDSYKKICNDKKIETEVRGGVSDKNKNLYTKGGEYVVKETMEEYIGYYHIHNDGTIMEFGEHLKDVRHRILIPIVKLDKNKKPCE